MHDGMVASMLGGVLLHSAIVLRYRCFNGCMRPADSYNRCFDSTIAELVSDHDQVHRCWRAPSQSCSLVSEEGSIMARRPRDHDHYP